MISEVTKYRIYLLLLHKCTRPAQLFLVSLIKLKCNIYIHVKSVVEHLFHVVLYLVRMDMGYFTVLYRYSYNVRITIPVANRSRYQPVSNITE